MSLELDNSKEEEKEHENDPEEEVMKSREKVMSWLYSEKFNANDACKSTISFKSEKSNESNQNDTVKIPEIRDEAGQELTRSDIFFLFKRLEVNNVYNITITNFESIEYFYAVSIDGNDEDWKTLKRRLKKSKSKLEVLHDIQPFDLCLVKSGKSMSRAIVQFQTDVSAMCYGVDDGNLFYFHHNKNPPIYKLPRKIRKTIQFQAIRCKLAGIKAVSQNRTWTESVLNTIIKKMEKPQIRVVSIEDNFTEDNNDPLNIPNLHTVVLIDAAAGNKNINDLLVQCKLAEPNNC